MNIALSRFAKTYWAAGPDVVLSGMNFGQNVGSTLNHSGTVGAAVTAREYGVPAIAFSAEVPRDLAQIPNVPFADDRCFRRSTWSRKRQGGKLLKPGLVLNVNYPFVGAGEDAGQAGRAPSPARRTTSGSPSTATSRRRWHLPARRRRAGGGDRQNADTTALAADKISVSRLDGDWTLVAPRPKLNTVLWRLRWAEK